VINDAEKQGFIRPYTGSRIFEGTVGSTGISIATIARARCVIVQRVFFSNSVVPEVTIRVCRLTKTIRLVTNYLLAAIIMPDDVAEEKVKALEALGATVERVRPASIVDKKQVRLSLVPLLCYFSDPLCNTVRCERATS